MHCNKRLATGDFRQYGREVRELCCQPAEGLATQWIAGEDTAAIAHISRLLPCESLDAVVDHSTGHQTAAASGHLAVK